MGTLQTLISQGLRYLVSSPKLANSQNIVNNSLFRQHLSRYLSALTCSPFGGSIPEKRSSKRSQILGILNDHGVSDDTDLQKRLLDSCEKTHWNANDLEALLNLLEDLSFNSKASAEMIAKYPALLFVPPAQTLEAWEAWSRVLMNGRVRRDLICSSPCLLEEKKKNIKNKFAQLRAVVVAPKYVAEILKKCPHIMLQSDEELQKVCDYLSINMFVRNASEYYKSCALGFPLSEIMLRHVFLERCGRYKRPNPRHSEHVPTGNPTLHEIYDTAPEDFATKVAGLTAEEFFVFEDLFESEIEDVLNRYNSDVESDYATDSDSD